MQHDLARAIAAYTAVHRSDGDFYPTETPSLTLVRAEAPATPLHALYETSLCVVAQGAKRVAVGDAVLDYGPGECLVVGLDVPAVGHVTRATADEPCLVAMLALDPGLLSEVARDAGVSADAPDGSGVGIFVGRPDARAVDALVRLVRLLETPRAIQALYPSVVRELYYWLLSGPGGAAFARLALPDGHARRVARAIELMKSTFPGPLRIDALADVAGMSPSSFRVHFKAATALTPLQYYKRLRLLEARRLLSTGGSAQDVAYRVGYESPSQFSREYARTFGAPPGRDYARSRLVPV